MQAAPVTDEAIDLELTLALVPHCEADHQIFISPDGSHPDCTVIATHVMTLTCVRQMALICRELAEWLSDVVYCTNCEKTNCMRVLPL